VRYTYVAPPIDATCQGALYEQALPHRRCRTAGSACPHHRRVLFSRTAWLAACLALGLGLTAAALAWLTSPSALAQSAAILVNSLADDAYNDSECTLREAIIAANTDTASGAMAGECSAGMATM